MALSTQNRRRIAQGEVLPVADGIINLEDQAGVQYILLPTPKVPAPTGGGSDPIAFEGDPKIFIDENGAFLEFRGGQPVMEPGLENDVLIALFTESGWVGNQLLPEGSRIGSDFEDLATGTLTLRNLTLIEDAAKRAMASDTYRPSDIAVVASNPSGKYLSVDISVEPQPGVVQNIELARNGLNWINQVRKA